MFKPPFFSIVIPVFNKEAYISRAINSVLAQSFDNFELIIVCDPSTDNSNKEVGKISDPRINVFHRTEPGPGGYAARNLGIQKSKGEWVAFLDADDEWYPNHLADIAKLSTKYTDVKVLISARRIEENGGVRLDKFSETLKENDNVFSFEDYLSYTLNYEHPFHPNVVKIKSELAKNHFSFPEGLVKRSGDLYAWVMLAYTAKSFAWTSAIGSILYKDVVGVSQMSAPGILFNRQMVDELREKINVDELIYLKKYANHLMKAAFFEQKRILGKTEASLFKVFYWNNNLKYCLFWATLSLLPQPILNTIKKIKNLKCFSFH